MLHIINKTKYKDLNKYEKDLEFYYHKTFEVLKIKKEYDVSMILIGPRKIKELNSWYREIDKETDVLSFALKDDAEFDIEENLELGDIFINRNRVYSQAKEYKHSIKREYCFLFVHGLLHLLGYDHMNTKDEKKMFQMQDKILGDLK